MKSALEQKQERLREFDQKIEEVLLSKQDPLQIIRTVAALRAEMRVVQAASLMNSNPTEFVAVNTMTAEEKEAQRRSFVYGNLAISNPKVTRELVDKVAEQSVQMEKDMNSSFPRILGGVEIVDAGDEWRAEDLKTREVLKRSTSLAEITDWAERRARGEAG